MYIISSGQIVGPVSYTHLDVYKRQELGFTLHTDKYFHTPLASHFITEDVVEELDFGEGMRNIYALNENTEIISYSNGEVHLGAHTYGKGRGDVYKRQVHFSMSQKQMVPSIHVIFMHCHNLPAERLLLTP